TRLALGRLRLDTPLERTPQLAAGELVLAPRLLLRSHRRRLHMAPNRLLVPLELSGRVGAHLAGQATQRAQGVPPVLQGEHPAHLDVVPLRLRPRRDDPALSVMLVPCRRLPTGQALVRDAETLR